VDVADEQGAWFIGTAYRFDGGYSCNIPQYLFHTWSTNNHQFMLTVGEGIETRLHILMLDDEEWHRSIIIGSCM
jgi:hypothetical protein